MKILYDYQIFIQEYSGIPRYFYELIKNFNKNQDLDIAKFLLFSNNRYISDKKDIDHIRFLPNYKFRGKQRLISSINKFFSIMNIKKQKFDVFHPTYYDPYFLDYIGNKPFVLTVCDMIHEKFKDMFPANDKTTKNKRTLCEKSSKIIAISENTKKDLIKLFSIEESKIKVIYLGNSMVLDNKLGLNIKVPEKYILFVGLRGRYKYSEMFIKSIARVLDENIDLSMVCVGGGTFDNNEIDLFNSLNIQNRIFQYSLDDDKLAFFYKNAELFVFPSLYEGFGIPILESFSCGCPLVCSNTGSLPEIAADGAEYFDPYSEESIYKAITKVLNSNKRKSVLIKNGTERLKYFSWEKTANETKKVYKSII